MTDQTTPLDAPFVLDDAITAQVFSTENMHAFLRLILPHLQGGNRVLGYVLPASGRFAHMALEPWALLNLFGDDFDEIVVVIYNQEILPFSRGMHQVASEVVRFVETDQELIMLMGHYDADPTIVGALRIQIQSASALLVDFWRYIRAGRPLRHLTLPSALEERATEFFNDIGVTPHDRVVALHLREGGYLAGQRYHSFRNMSSTNYELAVRHLLDQGNWVFRLGDRKSTPMTIDHPRFIDLPFLPNYEDFMDVVLLAKARFVIGCASGPEGPARALGTPVLVVNATLEQLPFRNPADIIQFKRYIDETNQAPMPYPDLLEANVPGFTIAGQYEARQIRVEENTAEEILHAVREMEARLDGDFEPDSEIDRKFRAFSEAFVARLEADDDSTDTFFGLALPWTNVCHAYCKANPWFLRVGD
jgi:putative glycosyltransferase (TIGR04372 family)